MMVVETMSARLSVEREGSGQMIVKMSYFGREKLDYFGYHWCHLLIIRY